MKCPVCMNVNLLMSERQGIEIDYCPECRGVWLDRNELDKIIERSNAVLETPREKQSDSYFENDRKDYSNDKDYKNMKKRKKKESIFSEMFDMFGD